MRRRKSTGWEVQEASETAEKIRNVTLLINAPLGLLSGGTTPGAFDASRELLTRRYAINLHTKIWYPPPPPPNLHL